MGAYHHLSRDDRDQIAGMRAAGLRLSEIGRAVGKSKSTVSRELRRKALDGGGRGWIVHGAAATASDTGAGRQARSLCAPAFV